MRRNLLFHLKDLFSRSIFRDLRVQEILVLRYASAKYILICEARGNPNEWPLGRYPSKAPCSQPIIDGDCARATPEKTFMELSFMVRDQEVGGLNPLAPKILTRPVKLYRRKAEDFALRGPFAPISRRSCA
jgi:hypothetical protein